jgi:protein arginine phosphatase
MRRIVLFVCTGNICRSPMAAALFNSKAEKNGEVGQWLARSAGTWALENQPASPHAISVMKERGIDLANHRGRQITSESLEEANVVIVMTQNHRDALAAEFPQHKKKIHLMSEIERRSYDITDPYGGMFSEYELCALKLEEMIERGYEQIKEWAQ